MFYFCLGSLVILVEDEQNLVVGVFIHAKNMLFLRYFYTQFMLMLIVIFRFLFDLIFVLSVLNKLRKSLVKRKKNTQK